jgi:hypothetical protein
VRERSALPQYLQECVPDTLEEALRAVKSNKVAPFLQSAGYLGRRPPASSRPPTLATAPSAPATEPLCALCGKSPSPPCTCCTTARSCLKTRAAYARPPASQERATAVVSTRGGWPTEGLATKKAETWSASFSWDGATPD